MGNLRASISSSGTLTIRNVIKSDSAWFECEANNGVSASAKAKAFLNVTCEYYVVCEISVGKGNVLNFLFSV